MDLPAAGRKNHLMQCPEIVLISVAVQKGSFGSARHWQLAADTDPATVESKSLVEHQLFLVQNGDSYMQASSAPERYQCDSIAR